MVYRLHMGVTGNKIQKLKQKTVNLTMAVVLGLTSLGSAPFAFIGTASALAVHTVCDSGCDYPSLQAAIDNAGTLDGDTIEIQSDLTISQRVNITKELTVDGQGHTLMPNFTGPGAGNSNNATLEIAADNITVENLTIDGTNGTTLHGINTYLITGAYIENVTLKNNDKNGLVVNGSEVTVHNLMTINNSWGGIDVDLGSGVTDPATLNLISPNQLTEEGAIVVDDITKNVTVNGADTDFVYTDYGDFRVYTQRPSTPTGLTIYRGHNSDTANAIPCDGYTNTTQIRIAWDANPESNIDYYWFGTASKTYHNKVSVPKTYYDGNMTPGKNPYQYSVIAVNDYGVESSIAKTCQITLDTDAPLVSIDAPSENEIINGTVDIRGSIADANPHHYYLRIENSAGAVKYSKVYYGDPQTFSNHTIYTWDTTAVDDGAYKIFLEARDAADNKDGTRTVLGDSVALANVIVDNDAPLIEITNVSENPISGEVTIDGTASDSGSGLRHSNTNTTGTPRVRVSFRAQPSNTVVKTFFVDVDGSGNWSTTIDTSAYPALVDGDYRIVARANDNVGATYLESNTAADTENVTIDNTAPEVDDDFTIDMRVGEKVTLEPEATDNNAGPFTYEWRVSDPLLLNNPQDSLDGEALEIGPTKKGSYDVYLIVKDKAGNESEEAHYIVTITTPEVAAPQSNENPQTLGATNNTSNSSSNNSRSNRTTSTSNTTETDETTVPEDGEGEVQGATTSTANLASATSDETTKSAGAFLGLGWWWLPLLVMLSGFFLIGLGRRSDDRN